MNLAKELQKHTALMRKNLRLPIPATSTPEALCVIRVGLARFRDEKKVFKQLNALSAKGEGELKEAIREFKKVYEATITRLERYFIKHVN